VTAYWRRRMATKCLHVGDQMQISSGMQASCLQLQAPQPLFLLHLDVFSCALPLLACWNLQINMLMSKPLETLAVIQNWSPSKDWRKSISLLQCHRLCSLCSTDPCRHTDDRLPANRSVQKDQFIVHQGTLCTPFRTSEPGRHATPQPAATAPSS
jgi:hypothetical protein